MKRFGRTWWGELWLNALEGVDYENRLPRGHGYANSYRVPLINYNDSVVSALVQGRREVPYHVEIELDPLTEEQKAQIVDAVKHNPEVLGAFVNGTLPKPIYGMTERNGIKLLPDSWSSLHGFMVTPAAS